MSPISSSFHLDIIFPTVIIMRDIVTSRYRYLSYTWQEERDCRLGRPSKSFHVCTGPAATRPIKVSNQVPSDELRARAAGVTSPQCMYGTGRYPRASLHPASVTLRTYLRFRNEGFPSEKWFHLVFPNNLGTTGFLDMTRNSCHELRIRWFDMPLCLYDCLMRRCSHRPIYS